MPISTPVIVDFLYKLMTFKFFDKEKRASVSVPTSSTQIDRMLTCSNCLRLNNPNARFCDWCGAFPDRRLIPIQCTKCHANNDSSAKFCSTCGCVLEPPLRITDVHLRNNLTLPSSSMTSDVS